jgi:hypothetical protein
MLALLAAEPRHDRLPSFLVSALFWAVVGYWALGFRIVQFRAYPRNAPDRQTEANHE